MLSELYNNLYNWLFPDNNLESETESETEQIKQNQELEDEDKSINESLYDLEKNNEVFLDNSIHEKTRLSPIIEEEYHPSNFYFLALKKDKPSDEWSIHVVFDLEKLNPIIDELKLKWYSTETSDEYFWSHEWEKHGSCMFTEMDELEYFQKALNLYNYVEANQIIKDYLEEDPLKCQIPFDSEFNLIEYY